jgi:hypothetical protein
MQLKDYEKAAQLVTDWHHARAMECLRKLNDEKLLDGERKDISDEYIKHRDTKEQLYKIRIDTLIDNL